MNKTFALLTTTAPSVLNAAGGDFMKKMFIASVDIFEHAWPYGYHIVRLMDMEGNEIGNFRNFGTKYEYKNTIQCAINTYLSNFAFNPANTQVNVDKHVVIIIHRL